MTSHEQRHGQPAVLASNDLAGIIAAWPDLVARVAAAGTGAGERVGGSRTPPVPIDAGVVDVMAEVEAWVNFLARVLIDEVPPEHGCGQACPPEIPATSCPQRRDPIHAAPMPGLLAQVAARVGHFTHHPDPELAAAFCDDAEHHRLTVEAAAHPTGRRWVRIGARCFEHDCAGHMRVLVDPEQHYRIPDIVCDRDRDHRIDPVEWQRAYRRHGEAQATVDTIARWRTSAPAG